METNNKFKAFEDLIAEVLLNLKFNVNRRVDKPVRSIDIEASKSKLKLGVEVRYYSTDSLSFTQLSRAVLFTLEMARVEKFEYVLLVVSGIVSRYDKTRVLKENGLYIWDYTDIVYLSFNNPVISNKLSSLLSNSLQSERVEGVNVYEVEKFSGPFDKLKKISHQHIELRTAGSEYCEKIKAINAGPKNWRKFELACRDILKYIFSGDLFGWYEQNISFAGLTRMDLIASIQSDHRVWRDLSMHFNTKYILFEFKNYKDPIKQNDVYITEKYLHRLALRSIGFIISREGLDDRVEATIHGILRESGKLVVYLTVDDLCRMARMRDTGEDYNSFLDDKITKLLISVDH